MIMAFDADRLFDAIPALASAARTSAPRRSCGTSTASVRWRACRDGRRRTIPIRIVRPLFDDNPHRAKRGEALRRRPEADVERRYMRHSSCAAGCLLLTYRGRQKFWLHPDTRERLVFTKVVEFLRDRARAIEKEDARDIRIEVFGLDLTDPSSA